MNGSTINGKLTGLRLNGGCYIKFSHNAVIKEQTKAIVELAPPGSTYDWSEWTEKVLVNLPSGQDFGGHSRFELRIKTPYQIAAD